MEKFSREYLYANYNIRKFQLGEKYLSPLLM